MAFLGADIEQFGTRIAAIDDRGDMISYAELARRADALAADIGRERQLILLEGDNDIAWLVAYVAALRGGHPMLIAPNGNDAARAALEAQFRPSLRMLAADDYRPQAVENGGGFALHEALAVMLSTSGSTGSTKCVRLSRANIAANAASIADYLQIGPDERGAVNLPTHYSYGLSIVNSHLHAGATMLLTRRSVIEKEFWAFLRTHDATSFAGVPHVYDLLERTDFAGSAPKSLRYFTQAGGRLAPDAALRFAELAEARGWRFYVMYGQTEATARIAYLPPDKAISHAGSIGVAIPKGRLALIDEAGAEIDANGVDGEMLYHGPNVMMGYAIGPDELALAPGPDRLSTGDIAQRDADGLFRITGRKSRFVKILGNRIGLDDVEALLGAEGHKAIATGIDDQLLVVTRQADAAPGIAALLAERLKLPPAYLDVRAVEEYPLLASGKVDYAGLKASLVAPSQAGGDKGSGPGSIEAAYVGVFGDAARDEDASFASLGGDSLNYVLVSMALGRIFARPPEGWEEMPIGTLAAMAAEQGPLGNGLPTIDTNVFVRAIAILGVVAAHSGATWLGGGANLLMLMVGYNLIRFRGPAMLAGRIWGNVAGYLRKIVVPAFLLNLAYMALKHDFKASGLLFYSNFTGPGTSPTLYPQWFVQVLVQCALLVALLLAIKPVRDQVRRSPFVTVTALALISIALRHLIGALVDTDAIYNRVPWVFMPLILIAWMMVLGKSLRQKAIVTAIFLGWLAIEPIDHNRALWLLVGGLALVWIPRVPIPNLVRTAVGTIAAAVFYIYLLHEVAMTACVTLLHLNGFWPRIAAGMLGPIAFWWLIEQSGLQRVLRRRLFGRWSGRTQ